MKVLAGPNKAHGTGVSAERRHRVLALLSWKRRKKERKSETATRSTGRILWAVFPVPGFNDPESRRGILWLYSVVHKWVV